MSLFTDPHKPGSRCFHHGYYRTYKKAKTGLFKTEYGCEVKNPSKFPPTPAEKHVFILEKSYEGQVGTQLLLFPYDPWQHDGDQDSLPLAA